ncbi:MAG: efflux RND transporter periplasmic adaptor subunit [Chitinophagaceae bacterium]|nr:efflux RND transporter periplasmic adaptor subunit [Chitinophagaceae bacterium]
MRITNLLISILLLILTACGGKDKKDSTQTIPGSPAKQAPISVDAIIAKTQTLVTDIDVPGSLLANETTEIHPEVSGRLVQLNVKEGTFVSRGALLAKLYDGDLQAQKRKVEVQLKIAEQTENRQNQLLKIQGISQQEYDLSLLQVHNLKADIDIINEAIRKTEIRAPFSGKLGFKNISPGAFINPATILCTISQVSQLKLQFTVPEKYSSKIKNGQNVDFTVDGSLKTNHAHVSATEVFIEENTRSLSVRAVVISQDPYLIPGAFAKVKIELGQDNLAIMIPTESVIPIGRKKQIYLFKSGKAMTMDITTGVRDSSRIQVLSGLNIGDTVITTGLLFLKTGSDIKISKVNPLIPLP